MEGVENNNGWGDFLRSLVPPVGCYDIGQGKMAFNALVCCINGINRSPCGVTPVLARNVQTAEIGMNRIKKLRPQPTCTYVRTSAYVCTYVSIVRKRKSMCMFVRTYVRRMFDFPLLSCVVLSCSVLTCPVLS